MIYIIIPVFNGIEHTKKCLNSLLLQDYKEYKIILVDDGSSDGTFEAVSRNFPHVEIIRGNGNWWWTRSINEGILAALKLAKRDDFILTLNNDLTVKPDYLKSLLTALNSNAPCIVGSLSVWSNDKERISFAGVTWDSWFAKYSNNPECFKSYAKLLETKEIIPTDLLPGRGTIFSVELINKIGLYDHLAFPQYTADEEFSLRAQKIGYKLLVSVKSVVFSDIEKTGINFKHGAPSWPMFIKSLSSIRSANFLPSRIRFAYRHGKIPYLYISFDIVRLFGSFIKHYVRSFFEKTI